MLAFTAVGTTEDEFTPTPSTPVPQTVREALEAPDVNEWRAAMDAEIEFQCVSRGPATEGQKDKNITAARWVFSINSRTASSLSAKAVSSRVDSRKSLEWTTMKLTSTHPLCTWSHSAPFSPSLPSTTSRPASSTYQQHISTETSTGITRTEIAAEGALQAGRIWHERLKADIEELGYTQCPRDHAVFYIGTWGQADWGDMRFLGR
jgi:hypothetical protein